MITEKLSQEEAFRYVMTLRMMGAGPDPNTNTFVKESQRLGLSLNQLVQQQTTLMQWNATVRDNMNTLGCDRISAPTPQNPGQPAANESQAEVSYRMVGAGMWFPQTGQPKGWDWSSREARTLEECAAICPHYRPNYSCKSFFYRSPDEGETAGRCDLHNFDRASGLIVEKDTVHSKPEWDYYEVAGGH